jgi:hypothetical protein
MTSSADYRRQAAALRTLANAAADRDEAFACSLRAVEFDDLADQAQEVEVRQGGIEPSPPVATASPDQPAQQQHPVQPGKGDAQD